MEPAETAERPAGPSAETAHPPSIVEAVGGPLGIAESALPAAVFVAAYTASGQDTRLAAILAVALGVVLTIARIVRGQTLQFALSGLFGIALAGFVVSRTGKAEDFFLPGLLANLAYAAGYLISILVRWPLIGVLVATMTQQGSGWRKDPALLQTYTRASWIWVGLFLTRLAVQLPLYLAGALVALGVARVAMGIPLFALGLWLTWLVVRRGAPHAVAPAAPSGS
ncbi:DUF3159 domain-containing protein [Patulibacter defluvii]|uniref:DUF3159 domain-containing protein n=1 Tax=Patulibacter defluvii TaxID=3095358 RepID=UPI002A75072F|nr:DUF3159 domain-containing protein [Patulibacter sp. DM4]